MSNVPAITQSQHHLAVAQINALEVRAFEAEGEPSEIRWEQARWVAEALAAGLSTRGLAAQWVNPETDEPYSREHVRRYAKCWAERDTLKVSGVTRFNTAYNSDAVRGSGLGVHYSSATPEWETPQDLFDELNQEFGFELDVCATAENAKCAEFYSPDQEGLSQSWEGVCWMNPPYGDEIVKWVRKAWESARDGATVVCLVPARTDTGWWWEYARHGEVRFLRGRLKFGGGTTGAPFPSAVVVFGRSADVIWWERAA